MPGVVRKSADRHVGHASATPNPFHQTSYAVGSPNVIVNGNGVVRIGDTTSCGDAAIGSSPDVYANGIKIHRLNDATTGHGTWVPNAAQTSSGNVFANGEGGNEPEGEPSPTTTKKLVKSDSGDITCAEFNWNTGVCESGEL